MPGHPLVYCTSKNFMDYFGINSADDLPKIKEVLAEQLVEPTVMKDVIVEEEENAAGEEIITTDELEQTAEMEKKVEAAEEESTVEAIETDETLLSVTDEGELIEKNEEGDEEA
jgi:segregation and condensation protein B